MLAYFLINVVFAEAEMFFATWCFWHGHQVAAWLYLIMSILSGTGVSIRYLKSQGQKVWGR